MCHVPHSKHRHVGVSDSGATGPGDRDWARVGGPLSAVTVLPGQTDRSTDTGCREVTSHGLAGSGPGHHEWTGTVTGPHDRAVATIATIIFLWIFVDFLKHVLFEIMLSPVQSPSLPSAVRRLTMDKKTSRPPAARRHSGGCRARVGLSWRICVHRLLSSLAPARSAPAAVLPAPAPAACRSTQEKAQIFFK